MERDGMERDGLEEDGMERDGKRRNWRSMTSRILKSLKSDVALTLLAGGASKLSIYAVVI